MFTPDDCQKHETQSSALELLCSLIQLFFVFMYFALPI